MSSTDDEYGLPVENALARVDDQDDLVHEDSQALLDALTRRARRLGRHIRRAKEPPVRILKLMD
ncbi:MAG: hypothetical protein ABR602_07260 [Gemmatimonadales bacterium]